MKKIIIATILLFSLFLSGCSLKNFKDQAEVQKKKNKVLIVIAPANFQDDEYNEVKGELEAGGAEVKVASIQTGQAIGMKGTNVSVELQVTSVKIEDFDAVVFIGGDGMDQINNDDSLKMLASNFKSAGKLVCAIDTAPLVMAKAGILKGRFVTVWPAVKEEIEKAGASYVPQPVVFDTKIITADNYTSTKEFAKKILDNL